MGICVRGDLSPTGNLEVQKWKVECRADSLVPLRFAILVVHLSKVLRLPRKSDARQNHLSKISEPTFQPSGTTHCGVPWRSLERKIQSQPKTFRLSFILGALGGLCRTNDVGPFWAYVGPMLGPWWRFLEGKNQPQRESWGVFWVTFWGYVGPMLGRFGSMLGPCWVIWRAIWGCMEVSGMKNSSPTENFSVAIMGPFFTLQRPPGTLYHKSVEKQSVSRLSDLFAHLHLLSSDSFSSVIFSLLLFSLLLFSLSDPFHLCFSSSILVWLLNVRRLFNKVFFYVAVVRTTLPIWPKPWVRLHSRNGRVKLTLKRHFDLF